MPFERPLHLSSLLRFISAPLIVRSFAFFLALSGAAQQRRFLRRTETSIERNQARMRAPSPVEG